MKLAIKVLSLLFVAFLSLSVTSCGDDDEIEELLETGNNYIMINDVKYPISSKIELSNSWYPTIDQIEIGFFMKDIEDYLTPVIFTFDCDQEPKVGLVLKNMHATFFDYYIDGSSLDQISGTVRIKSMDKKKETITLQFDNVKIRDTTSGSILTLSGNPTFSFDYNYEYD